MLLDSIYDRDVRSPEADVDFGRGDPVEIFSGIAVYAEFDSDKRDRRPVTWSVPGYAGRWVLAYSSLEKLRSAHRNEDVEYSAVSGARLLVAIPEGAGVWFDRSCLGGRAILLPRPDPDDVNLPQPAP